MVRPRVLCALAGTQSPRYGIRGVAWVARRLLAASYKGDAVRRPLQHPSAISVCGLRLSRGVRCLKGDIAHEITTALVVERHHAVAGVAFCARIRGERTGRGADCRAGDR